MSWRMLRCVAPGCLGTVTRFHAGPAPAALVASCPRCGGRCEVPRPPKRRRRRRPTFKGITRTLEQIEGDPLRKGDPMRSDDGGPREV